MADKKKRIEFLDGLRGVAIIWVMFFHAYVRWSQLTPYKDTFASFPLFQYGWLGVHLFFLISGFVILMTLEKTNNFPHFMYRRWLRLFPAMLVCSAIIFLTAGLFPERPAGIPVLRDILPGVTFIQPGLWEKIFHSPVGSLEGWFWSLFVEVKFYCIFGILYFWLGINKALLGLIALFACHIARLPFVDLLAAEYMGWFTAGALFYRYHKSLEKRWLFLGIFFALLSAIFLPADLGAKLSSVAVVALFVTSVCYRGEQAFLSGKFLIFLGFVSYPLYLIHENMMLALIVKSSPLKQYVPVIFLPILPMIFVMCVAWFIAVYAEPHLRNYFRFCFETVQAKMSGSKESAK